MRQGIQAGKPVEEAIVDALDTSGRAVLFAGITVCIALLGMFALGVSFLYGVAIAASIAVACTVIAALTILPSILSFIGPRVLSRRQRRALGTSAAADALPETGGTGFWTRWAGFVSRRPNLVGATATLLVLIIAIPFLTMRLGSADAGSDPTSTTTRKAYDLLAAGLRRRLQRPAPARREDRRQRGPEGRVRARARGGGRGARRRRIHADDRACRERTGTAPC